MQSSTKLLLCFLAVGVLVSKCLEIELSINTCDVSIVAISLEILVPLTILYIDTYMYVQYIDTPELIGKAWTICRTYLIDILSLLLSLLSSGKRIIVDT